MLQGKHSSIGWTTNPAISPSPSPSPSPLPLAQDHLDAELQQQRADRRAALDATVRRNEKKAAALRSAIAKETSVVGVAEEREPAESKADPGSLGAWRMADVRHSLSKDLAGRG